MHSASDDHHARTDDRASLAAIIDVAEADLPKAAGLGMIALMSSDDEIVQAMLEQIYELALDSEHCYLADLVDTAMRRLEMVSDQHAAGMHR